MIISASRRTDIPAFYTPWFINRIKAGFCTVPNPFNHKQVSYVSLNPKDVDVVVFWTRNPRPLMRYLDELDRLGFRYYFQFTVMNNPRWMEQKTPPLESSIKSFIALSHRIGSDKVIWRYDPIVFSRQTGSHFHLKMYGKIASALKGYARRSVISIVDIYKHAKSRLWQVANQDDTLPNYTGYPSNEFDKLMFGISEIARENGMEIVSCAESINLQPYGIMPGKCIDDKYIEEVFDIDVTHRKDPNQRPACGCVSSKDIGIYNTCLFGCQYCYATSGFGKARLNYQQHDVNSPSLIGWYEAKQQNVEQHQLHLFRLDD